MASFTITLYPEGAKVAVVKGEHAGRVGTVAGWLHIGPRELDPVHSVKLDKPIAVPPKVHGSIVLEPEHTIETIEAKASELADVP